MRALVIVESMFGNTNTVATAVAQGLSASFATELVDVAQAPTAITEDVQLLVLGGPTHAFGMTRSNTRKGAAQQGADTDRASGIGIREWLLACERSSNTTVAATFDTRVRKRGIPGSAARGAQRRLRKLGFTIASPAMSFYVLGTPGPLVEGELARAIAWGAQVGSASRKLLEHSDSRRT